MSYFIEPLKKMFVFNGRTSRKNFWLWRLWSIIATQIISLLMNIGNNAIIVLVFMLILLAFWIADIAITIRRLHDIDKPGTLAVIQSICFFMTLVGNILITLQIENNFVSSLMLCGLPTVILSIIILCWTLRKGDIEDNKYGVSPYKK